MYWHLLTFPKGVRPYIEIYIPLFGLFFKKIKLQMAAQ